MPKCTVKLGGTALRVLRLNSARIRRKIFCFICTEKGAEIGSAMNMQPQRL
jgi:hypothetical protein